MGNIQAEIDRIGGAKTTLEEYLRARGVVVDASSRIDVLAGKLQEIANLSLTGISIATPPTKVEYKAGETFDPTGMVVTATFSNGAELVIANYTTTPAGALEVGTTSITVSLSFNGETKTAIQAIAVTIKQSMSYSGTHTIQEVAVDGITYKQYTITGAGTLTVEGTYENAGIWVCGGGAWGASGSGSLTYAYGGSGGAGAYCASYTGTITEGIYAVTVGSAGGASSVGTLATANGASGKNGGTGGGSSGKGDGISKVPFDDTTNFESHCGGGGGGAWREKDTSFNYSSGTAGNGGTNGGNGTYGTGTSGGVKGGGNGGAYWRAGYPATFYGSGGGGGGGVSDAYDGGQGYGGAAGYQGVVYIRVPA